MQYYDVYVSYSVSHVIRVPANEVDSVEGAKELALEDVDLPNAGNKFEQDSEPYVVNVRDSAGNLLWEDTGEQQ
ncbi:hypothetical protein [Mycolicibacterium llatzerense]|uniref:hypothetical protein n=1 Tax=Mycolicibacterium llatzerense TaxID=280871 RepID=UPI0021B65A88|nr:hypothetical protein [Mycolicibacterium llatzerense]MCT7373000.1 hypothetical protein [Mycolicibacterium llatzerense]